jgi:hypothetical protein
VTTAIEWKIIECMKNVLRYSLAIAAALAALPIASLAHFKLVEPAQWITTTNNLGDPQKIGPCGGDPKGDNEKLLTNAITKATGGAKLHIKIEETIYHSGHYRVALAVNSRNELPPDPTTTEKFTDKGVYSVWAAIQSPPQIPILVDGLFQHYPEPGQPDSALLKTPMAPWETDIKLPNISCPKCTLQVIQFMAGHPYNQPGGYAYHHCADLQITADPSKPLDKGWPLPAAPMAAK